MKSSKFRWIYAAGAAVACAGVLVTTSLVANAGDRPLAQPGAQPAAQPGVPAAGQPAELPVQKSAAPEDQQTVGDIVKTGSGDWVLYAQTIKEKRLPKIHFGVMLGRRSADGALEDAVMANEVEGSDRAPGFHAVQGSMNVNGRQTLTFGYYVGPAEKITGKAHGKQVTAGLATWSEDSSVHFFWFAPSVQEVGHLVAFDKSGEKLPTGDATIGVG